MAADLETFHDYEQEFLTLSRSISSELQAVDYEHADGMYSDVIE